MSKLLHRTQQTFRLLNRSGIEITPPRHRPKTTANILRADDARKTDREADAE